MALACSPQLIIADEPTTALDVIVQDQILKELKRIQTELGMSIIYISHDIAVIAEVTDSLGVMYAGKLVEYGPTTEVFARPKHPYAYLLLKSTPSITGPRRQLAPLEGEPPDLLAPPTGCRFHPRCPFATERCAIEEPPLADIGGGHRVACWHWEQVPDLEEALLRGPSRPSAPSRCSRCATSRSTSRSRGGCSAGRPGSTTTSTGSASRSPRGRAWASSASPVAGSPPPAGCS